MRPGLRRLEMGRQDPISRASKHDSTKPYPINFIVLSNDNNNLHTYILSESTNRK